MSSTRRARLALVACLVWLVGGEVLPDLHLALHERLGAHHHDGDPPTSTTTADGLTVRVHRDSIHHRHGGIAHQHATPEAAPVDRDAVRPGRPGTAPHGAHSLAHRALAWIGPAPVLEFPLPVDRRPSVVAEDVARLVAAAALPEAAARGPPA